MSGVGREQSTLWVVVGINAGLFMLVGLFGVFYPFTLEPYEGTSLLPATRIAAGLPIYGEDVLLKPPHLWAAYGPVYYLLTGLAMNVTGPAFLPGRLLSLLATAATGATIFYFVRRAGSKTGALVSIAIFTALPTTWSFGSINRVDALGVSLSVACVSIAGIAGQRFGMGFAAGIAGSLAVLTKPNLLAGLVTVGVTLLINGRRSARPLLGLAVGFLVGVAGVASVLYATGNSAYWSALLVNAEVPFSLGRAVALTRSFFQHHIVVMAAVSWALGVHVLGKGQATQAATWFPVIAGFVAIIGSAKEGSSINYFCELAAALSIGAGLGVSSIDRAAPLRAGGTTVMVVVVALSTLAQILLYFPSALQGRVLIPASKHTFYEQTIQLLKDRLPEGGTVGGEYPELALFAGKVVVQNDFAMFALGPPKVRAVFDEAIAGRSVDAWIFVSPAKLPGYLPANAPFISRTSLSGVYFPGPILFLRSGAVEGTPD